MANDDVQGHGGEHAIPQRYAHAHDVAEELLSGSSSGSGSGGGGKRAQPLQVHSAAWAHELIARLLVRDDFAPLHARPIDTVNFRHNKWQCLDRV